MWWSCSFPYFLRLLWFSTCGGPSLSVARPVFPNLGEILRGILKLVKGNKIRVAKSKSEVLNGVGVALLRILGVGVKIFMWPSLLLSSSIILQHVVYQVTDDFILFILFFILVCYIVFIDSLA